MIFFSLECLSNPIFTALALVHNSSFFALQSLPPTANNFLFFQFLQKALKPHRKLTCRPRTFPSPKFHHTLLVAPVFKKVTAT